jgi:hypothetical protein
MGLRLVLMDLPLVRQLYDGQLHQAFLAHSIRRQKIPFSTFVGKIKILLLCSTTAFVNKLQEICKSRFRKYSVQTTFFMELWKPSKNKVRIVLFKMMHIYSASIGVTQFEIRIQSKKISCIYTRRQIIMPLHQKFIIFSCFYISFVFQILWQYISIDET